MPIETRCPKCRTEYLLADVQAGKRVLCRHCKDAFVVPRTNTTQNARWEEVVESPDCRRPVSVERPIPWVLVATVKGIFVIGVLILAGANIWFSLPSRTPVLPVAVRRPPPPVRLADPGVDLSQVIVEPRTVDQALLLLTHPNIGQRGKAADFLSKQPVDPDWQQAVARALEKQFQEEPNHFTREACLRALAFWGDKDTTILFLQIASTTQDNTIWNLVMDSLVKQKETRLVVIAVRNLTNFSRQKKAAETLRTLGPEVGPTGEPLLQPLLQDRDSNVRKEAIRLLGAIGTRASIPLLEKIRQRERLLAPMAQQAIQEISKRGGND